MKECDYCGRENVDDAVYCRECGTEKFKNDPPAVQTPFTLGEFLKNCADSLDELASSKEVLLSWVMVAWIGLACMHLIRASYGQSASFFGLDARWAGAAGPLLMGATFLLAPLIGIWSLARWLRQGQKKVLLNLMAWMLLAFFVTVFCIVWLVLWNMYPSGWLNFVSGY